MNTTLQSARDSSPTRSHDARLTRYIGDHLRLPDRDVHAAWTPQAREKIAIQIDQCLAADTWSDVRRLYSEEGPALPPSLVAWRALAHIEQRARVRKFTFLFVRYTILRMRELLRWLKETGEPWTLANVMSHMGMHQGSKDSSALYVTLKREEAEDEPTQSPWYGPLAFDIYCGFNRSRAPGHMHEWSIPASVLCEEAEGIVTFFVGRKTFGSSHPAASPQTLNNVILHYPNDDKSAHCDERQSDAVRTMNAVRFIQRIYAATRNVSFKEAELCCPIPAKLADVYESIRGTGFLRYDSAQDYYNHFDIQDDRLAGETLYCTPYLSHGGMLNRLYLDRCSSAPFETFGELEQTDGSV